VAENELVAVGRRLCHAVDAGHAASAADVFHNDRLTELAAQSLGKNAGDRIGRSAGRERHHHRDRPRRIVLRARRERSRGRRAAEQRDERASFHVWMAPAWQEIIWRAAQRSLAVMCPACWCSPGGLLALMGSANRVLIIQTGSMSR